MHPFLQKSLQSIQLFCESLNKSELEQHRRQGHFPFHADCLSCQAAKSTTQHRRKKKSVLSSKMACAFFFWNFEKAKKGSFKYLIMVNLTTGMKGVVPVQSDIHLSHRWIQAWLGEFNMSTECSEPIEIITDAEEVVSSFMKGAISHRTASCVKAPPQGHQTIGGAEAGVRAIKMRSALFGKICVRMAVMLASRIRQL